MKKILMTLAVIATTFFAAEAQTKKKKSSKKSTPSADTRLKSDIAKIKTDKKMLFDSLRTQSLQEDSMRLAEDSIMEFQTDSMRMAWKEQKLKEVDSINQEKWKNAAQEKEAWYDFNRNQDMFNKKAKLNDMKGRQVKAINQEYSEKAEVVRNMVDLSPADRMQQYTALNNERRQKIQEIVGKKTEAKLEKIRKEFSVNNEDSQLKWMDDVTPMDNQKK